MSRLSLSFQYYLLERTQTHDHWKNLKIIFSDASVPGEGEHKLLDFIRSQRVQPGYDANTSHCIYGADADLIMLGLIIHEPHFYILREALVDFRAKKQAEDERKMAEKLGEVDTGAVIDSKAMARGVAFCYVKIPVLREYLNYEFQGIELPFAYDFERVIDDFVFLCFFVGNDFLPHLPSLEIREGAIDLIMFLYKEILPNLDGYLTENGRVVLDRVEILFSRLAKIEGDFFI
jgi:5'-3' exoribonuclease 2